MPPLNKRKNSLRRWLSDCIRSLRSRYWIGGVEEAQILSKVDHLVFGTPELSRGINEIEELTGMRAMEGGQHPGQGTHNALLSLGPTSYLEIIAPDPNQPVPQRSRAFGLDELTESKLVTWAAKGNDLESLRSKALRFGLHLGEVRAGSRQRPDGKILSWKATSPMEADEDGLIPFFIDWESSPHPAQSAPHGLELVGLRAEHPDAACIEESLKRLDLHLPVTQGSKAALIATVSGPLGIVELR